MMPPIKGKMFIVPIDVPEISTGKSSFVVMIAMVPTELIVTPIKKKST